MKPRRVLNMLSIVFVVAVAALLRPQQAAQAKTCYDSSKQVIPCPKSSLVLTQEAAKQALAAQTAIPSATATASPLPTTATATPVPATMTATASPAPTATAVPAATSTPVAAAVVVPPSASGNDDIAACRALPYRGVPAGLGFLAAGLILLTAARITNGSSDAFAYGHSAGQQQVIKTAFGESSARANQRLGNAGPVSASGVGTGAAGQAKALVSAARLARLLAWPSIGIGGLQLAVSAGQIGRVLGCSIWPGPVAGSGVAAVGIGLALPALAVTAALFVAAFMALSVKYSLFLPAGTPERGTVHVAMKQPSGQAGSSGSGASSDGQTDGDDSSDPTP